MTTKAELLEMAAELGVEVDASWRKGAIVAAIDAHLEETPDPVENPVGEPVEDAPEPVGAALVVEHGGTPAQATTTNPLVPYRARRIPRDIRARPRELRPDPTT